MKRMLWAVLTLFLLAGCGGYWQVVDPTSKTTYYTREVKRTPGGTVQFTDAKTGKQVTLQNSEVLEVSKDDFKAGTGAK